MSRSAVLELVKPQEYFRSCVSQAQQDLKLRIDDGLEYYLVNLLCDFIDPAKLKSTEDEVDPLSTPLAIMLKKAIESSPGAQVRIFKRLGDTSLYFAGFFQGYFTRKSFDIDYYIAMGSSAYNRVSHLMRDRHGDEHFSTMYQSLAGEFQNLVEIVATVAESQPESKNNSNLLAVYDQWTRTPTDRLRKILEEQGIQPIPKPKQAQ